MTKRKKTEQHDFLQAGPDFCCDPACDHATNPECALVIPPRVLDADGRPIGHVGPFHDCAEYDS